MEKSPARRAKLSGLERKNQILLTAADVFSRHGFKGTTLRQLARRAGISEAVIYHHFPSKEALYDAMLEEKVRQIQNLLPIDSAAAKHDRIVFEKVAGSLLEQQAKDSSFMRLLLFSALEGHELAGKFMRGPRQEIFDFLGSYLEQRIEDGALRRVDSRLALRALLGLAFYFALIREVFNDPVICRLDLDELTTFIVDIFCHGIKENGNASRSGENSPN